VKSLQSKEKIEKEVMEGFETERSCDKAKA